MLFLLGTTLLQAAFLYALIFAEFPTDRCRSSLCAGNQGFPVFSNLQVWTMATGVFVFSALTLLAIAELVRRWAARRRLARESDAPEPSSAA